MATTMSTVPKTAFLEISINGEVKGRMEITLFANTPISSTNFGLLCQGHQLPEPIQDKSILHYKGTKFHRIVPRFVLQGGQVIIEDVTVGGGSAVNDGLSFPDENFRNYHGKGFLSYANSGKNTNGSQFFISMNDNEHLDCKHCVFGVLADQKSYDVASMIEMYGDKSGNASAEVVISDCGVTSYYTQEEADQGKDDKTAGKRSFVPW